MENNKDMFDKKLKELSQQYVKLQNHIEQCQDANQDKIREEIIKIKSECAKYDFHLKDSIDFSRSSTVYKLADAQLDYNKNIEDILSKDTLPHEESAALYAEYAIDFATQSIRYALLAALNAIDLQLTEEEKNKKRSDLNE